MSSKMHRQEPPVNYISRRVPRVINSGEILLDPWWGAIQPMQLHPDVKTIGELEMMQHLEGGGVVIDTRQPEYVYDSGSIQGAIFSPWQEIVAVFEDLQAIKKIDKETIIALYCNGPQCAATPRAIELLEKYGWPMNTLLYYRGGIMDWMALGLPVSK